jgi:DNA-binding NarL/FixJ family response regulator
LIADTSMPRRGGLALCEYVMRERPETKVVVVCETADGSAVDGSLPRRAVEEILDGS